MIKSLDQDHSDRRVRTVCLLILTMIASGMALTEFRGVLVPFVLAVFFSYCLAPIIDFQVKKLRFPQGLAIVGTGFLGLATLAVLGVFLSSSVSQMLAHQTEYQQRFAAINDWLTTRFGGSSGPDGESRQFINLTEETVRSSMSTVLGEILNLISSGVIVGIFVLFLLLGRSTRSEGQSRGLLEEIERKVMRFISETVFFAALTGALVGATLTLLRVEFAWVFGFLTFLLNFIPSLGSFIAVLLPLPMILIDSHMSVGAKVLALVIPATVQFVIGNIIVPKVQGKSLDLHPVTVMLALIFFGQIWGMVGAFLATPITAVIKIVFERIPATKPVADLLAGNLAFLSQTESLILVTKEA